MTFERTGPHSRHQENGPAQPAELYGRLCVEETVPISGHQQSIYLWQL